MNISNHAAASAGQMHQSLGIALLKTSTNVQAAGAVLMLQKFTQSQNSMQKPSHPNLGRSLDIQA